MLTKTIIIPSHEIGEAMYDSAPVYCADVLNVWADGLVHGRIGDIEKEFCLTAAHLSRDAIRVCRGLIDAHEARIASASAGTKGPK